MRGIFWSQTWERNASSRFDFELVVMGKAQFIEGEEKKCASIPDTLGVNITQLSLVLYTKFELMNVDHKD